MITAANFSRIMPLPFLLVFTPSLLMGQVNDCLGIRFPDSLYQVHTWKSFEDLPMANDTIRPGALDHSLLNAAVFFMTNKAREQHGLRGFRFSPYLRNMASFHADQMSTYKFVGHINYYHLGFATLSMRSRKFQAAAGAENVANMFLYNYLPRSRYQTFPVEGEGFEYITPAGDKIPRHTYLSFARMLVNGWMHSPSHRANILDPTFDTLGCGQGVAEDAFRSYTIPIAYCVQNFGL